MRIGVLVRLSCEVLGETYNALHKKSDGDVLLKHVQCTGTQFSPLHPDKNWGRAFSLVKMENENVSSFHLERSTFAFLVGLEGKSWAAEEELQAKESNLLRRILFNSRKFPLT